MLQVFYKLLTEKGEKVEILAKIKKLAYRSQISSNKRKGLRVKKFPNVAL